MCDPVTATALAIGVGGGAEIWGNREAVKASDKAAVGNLKRQYAEADTSRNKSQDYRDDQVSARAFEGNYAESAIAALGFDLGVDSDGAAILQREAAQSTARDVNALNENYGSALDDIDNFQRNSLSQYKQTIKGARTKQKSQNIGTALNLAQQGASLYMGASANPAKG